MLLMTLNVSSLNVFRSYFAEC